LQDEAVESFSSEETSADLGTLKHSVEKPIGSEMDSDDGTTPSSSTSSFGKNDFSGVELKAGLPECKNRKTFSHGK
jgi:hypothetical protein